ncbi:hypothetical protein OG500_09510 [Kitasatospora sp. NBC_01250]|uniref:hypothetical protein n=1 Tax=unclassified Kitasatospora TaxID=2633591 RepID=UPI002E0F91BA|nr:MULTISPECIES: hypothetical protein [unclassified Kitasatospora]WSJ66404.1 hypothetical protein OG294_09870 [Kitasatospora sp. NBC_01302]
MYYSLRRPPISAGAIALTPSGRWQWAAVIPLAVAGLVAVFVRASAGRGICLAFGVAVALLVLVRTRVLLALDGDRLVVRLFVVWKTVALDRLAEARALPRTRGGPVLRITDRDGHGCHLMLSGLRPAGLAQLRAVLRRQLAAGGVRTTGPVTELLAD